MMKVFKLPQKYSPAALYAQQRNALAHARVRARHR